MKKEVKEMKICLKCHKPISNEVKRVRISIFNEDGSVKHQWFHWECKTKQPSKIATVTDNLLGGSDKVTNFIDNLGKSMEKTIASMPE